MIATISRICLKTLPVWVIVLIVVELLLANELVGLGRRVKLVDQEIDTVVRNNDTLGQQIASVSSLLVVEQKAMEFGFIPTKKYLTLISDEFPVAYHALQ